MYVGTAPTAQQMLTQPNITCHVIAPPLSSGYETQLWIYVGQFYSFCSSVTVDTHFIIPYQKNSALLID